MSVAQSGSKRWLNIAKILWVILAIIYAGVFLFAVSRFVSEGHEQLAPILAADEWPGIEFERALAETGLTPGSLTSFFVGMDIVQVLIFATVGLLIFLRKSDNWIGLLSSLWLIAFGIVFTQSSGTGGVGEVLPPHLVGFLFWGVILLLILFLYTFPNGMLVPRWGSIPIGLFILYILGSFFFPENPGYESYEGLFITSNLVIGVGGQIHRYRQKADAVSKQQTRWLVLAASFFVVFLVVIGAISSLFPHLEDPGPTAIRFQLLIIFGFFLTALMLPIAIGVSILKYRLWDIEVVVNRALIYGSLTALLAAIWAGAVALINQATTEMFGSESATTATVVATLLVATVFQPLRDRLEKWINKRFYPEKLDLAEDFVEFAPEVRDRLGAKRLAEIVARRVCELLDIQHAAVFLAKAEKEFSPLSAYQIDEKGLQAIQLEEKQLGELRRKRVVPAANPKPFPYLVPLFVHRVDKNQVVGLLAIGSRKNDKGFSGDDLKALAELGRHAGTAIFLSQLGR